MKKKCCENCISGLDYNKESVLCTDPESSNYNLLMSRKESVCSFFDTKNWSEYEQNNK